MASLWSRFHRSAGIKICSGHPNKPGGSAILIDALHQFCDQRVVKPGGATKVVISAQLLALCLASTTLSGRRQL
jgi:hypothetical protein